MQRPHFMYDIFGVPYVGHMMPEHYHFLKMLPTELVNSINDAHEQLAKQVMNRQGSIEAEFERINTNAR